MLICLPPLKMYNKNIWSFKGKSSRDILFQLSKVESLILKETVGFSFQIIIKTCMTNLILYHLFIKYNELNNQAEFS